MSEAAAQVLAQLRRWPDVEAANLVAVDATDRLLLAVSADAVSADDTPAVAVIWDNYGALTLATAASGVGPVRCYQDLLVGELALRANAERLGITDRFTLTQSLTECLSGAQVVLAQAPKSLDALDALAAAVALDAAPSVRLFVGGRVKHLSPAVSATLSRHFSTVTTHRAVGKSRIYEAQGPLARDAKGFTTHRDEALGLTLAATAGTFGGARVDPGTRFLLQFIAEMKPSASTAIDLGSGNGVIAAALAEARPALGVLALDQSRSAVDSSRETARLNNLASRIEVERCDGLRSQPPASAELIVCNPPFHSGASVQPRLLQRLLQNAREVLCTDGELWCVYNSHLQYRSLLTQLIGPTRQVARNPRFTVTVSRRGR